jgi:hypothetical protein
VSCPLIQFDRWICQNLTGVVTVKLVVPDDVATYTSTTAEAGIEVNPGAQIYHIPIDPGSGGHREDLRGSVHGDYHERRVSFSIRRLRQEVVDLRQRLMNRRVHVIFTDENGLTYLYLNSRLRAAAANNPAQGRNETTFEFRAASKLPASYVIGELLPGPVTGGDLGEGEDPFVVPPSVGGETGGQAGVGPDDDIGGPGDVTPPDGGGDPNPIDPNDITFLQPSTGNFYKIVIGPCEEVITIPV